MNSLWSACKIGWENDTTWLLANVTVNGDTPILRKKHIDVENQISY